jgi:hypothetical protein
MARIVGQGNMPRKQKAIRLDNTNNTRIWETKKMTIDELQERFNELRGKKWRMVDTHEPVEFVGFIIGNISPTLYIKTGGEIIQLEPYQLSRAFMNGCFPCIEEDIPYADWSIDARAYFWDGGLPAHKYKGHFAGLNHAGKPMMFAHGMTSFTKMGGTITFTYAELAEN